MLRALLHNLFKYFKKSMSCLFWILLIWMSMGCLFMAWSIYTLNGG